MPHEDDSALIKKALSGDQAAYQRLLARHKATVFHIVFKMVRNREEADDLVQETFMKAFASLASYREEFRFTTWLYRIAANAAIDSLRKQKIEAMSLDEPVETEEGTVGLEIADTAFNPEEDALKKEKGLSILDAIASLPPKYREVIELVHLKEKPYDEIAAILKVPVGTVKARIFRARELLKKKLKSLRSY
jgi:RNA polymerase sigma-70 factor (ECF subfamily)